MSRCMTALLMPSGGAPEALSLAARLRAFFSFWIQPMMGPQSSALTRASP